MALLNNLYFIPLSSLSGEVAVPHNEDTGNPAVYNTEFQLTGPTTTIEVRDVTNSGIIGVNDQRLNDDNAFNTQTLNKPYGPYNAGAGVEVNYSYTATGSDGSTVTIYSIAMNNDNSLLGAAEDQIVGYVSSVPLKPGVTYTVGGLGSIDSTVDPLYADLVPCFTAGTLIETADGARPVEELSRGDLVLTKDRGTRPIRWIGRKHLDAAALTAAPNLRPIRIRAGALGDGKPCCDLTVSPQHRVLVRSRIAERMFGEQEVLVAAKHLISIEGIDIAQDMAEVRYFHFLFDAHEVVISNGAETESLYVGEQALAAVGPEAAEEIFALFPELRRPACEGAGARYFVPGRLGRKLAQRHIRNARALVA